MLFQHKLLAKLGPEPLTDAFDGERLFTRSRGRKAPVKTFVMDNAVVVGVVSIPCLFVIEREPAKMTDRFDSTLHERRGYQVAKDGKTVPLDRVEIFFAYGHCSAANLCARSDNYRPFVI